MDLLEIAHLAERNTNEMSSGEARRILIARALVHDPQALVLDEPTTSLDLMPRTNCARSCASWPRAASALSW